MLSKSCGDMRMATSLWRVKRRVFVVIAGLSCTVTQLGFLPSCEGLLTTFNPCGTIFGFCTERDVDLFFADVPDFDLDPTCTVPFACGDPILPNPGPRP
jgi:hypothetical protein